MLLILATVFPCVLATLETTNDIDLPDAFFDVEPDIFPEVGRRHRTRRAPAVWGDPAPDYSAARLDGTTTFLYALLFVDSKITDHYNNDMSRVRKEILKLVKEANEYFFQINLRVIVVDIRSAMRNDLSLYSFEDYRNDKLNILPYHNFAALISFKYAGGLAFVQGMCSTKSVMLAGFYPHNPAAMGSIFFHEVAHLMGVPHSHPNETLTVPNCPCATDSESGKGGCLKIPGFDHDCTLQLMANLVYRNRCLPRRQRDNEANKADGYTEWQSDESVSLCGNGVVEPGESCDCGTLKRCDAWNCDPLTCSRPVPIWVIAIATFCVSAAIIAPLALYCHFRIMGRYKKRTVSTSLSRIVTEPLFYLKRLIFKRSANSRHRSDTFCRMPQCDVDSSKFKSASVVVMRPNMPESSSYYEKQTLRRNRPNQPPPPPPIIKLHATLERPRVPPPRPPPPATQNSDHSFVNHITSHRTEVPLVIGTVPFRPLCERLKLTGVDRESISHKFADFDEDELSMADSDTSAQDQIL